MTPAQRDRIRRNLAEARACTVSVLMELEDADVAHGSFDEIELQRRAQEARRHLDRCWEQAGLVRTVDVDRTQIRP